MFFREVEAVKECEEDGLQRRDRDSRRRPRGDVK